MQESRFSRKIFKDPQSATLEVLEFSVLPFTPKRLYWIFDFDENAVRGNHAHKSLRQLFVIIKGHIYIDIKDQTTTTTHLLNEKDGFLLLESGYWRVLRDPSPDSILLVIVDQPYSEDDYIRNWDEFLDWRKNLV